MRNRMAARLDAGAGEESDLTEAPVGFRSGVTGEAALAADIGHVAAVLGDGLAALLAGFSGLCARELVRCALLVRRLPTLARDLAHLFFGHRGESAFDLARHTPPPENLAWGWDTIER